MQINRKNLEDALQNIDTLMTARTTLDAQIAALIESRRTLQSQLGVLSATNSDFYARTVEANSESERLRNELRTATTAVKTLEAQFVKKELDHVNERNANFTGSEASMARLTRDCTQQMDELRSQLEKSRAYAEQLETTIQTLRQIPLDKRAGGSLPLIHISEPTRPY